MAFDRLLGNAKAIGAQCHRTSDTAHSWNNILRSGGLALGRLPILHHVATPELLKMFPELEGPLLGDKANSMQFDNSRLRELIGSWECELSLDDGLSAVKEYFDRRLQDGYQPDVRLDQFIDQLVSAG